MKEIQGSVCFKIWLVTGYHWLPEFLSQVGHRLPMVTKFYDFDRLPFLNEADVTGYHRLPTWPKSSYTGYIGYELATS